MNKTVHSMYICINERKTSMSSIQNKRFINNKEAVASIVDTILLAPHAKILNSTQSMQTPSAVYSC